MKKKLYLIKKRKETTYYNITDCDIYATKRNI